MPQRLPDLPPGEVIQPTSPHALATPGGVIRAVWDEGAPVTPSGPLIYFAQYLQASGLWPQAVATCPLRYMSPNAPRIAEVLGTLLLTVLHGGRRYLHAASIRFDPIIGEALGMRRILSHESIRRAIARDGADLMQEWLRLRLHESVRPALRRPWILDEDVTSRVVYGTQEGAVVGYNGKKPGHPSLALHTYVVAHLRLVLDVQLRPGNETSGAHGHQGLMTLIAALPPEERPALVRGDIAYGFEEHMSGLEHLGIRYLFKVRRSDGVKQLIADTTARSDWIDAGKGWQGLETTLRLLTWSKARRAVILRRPETKRPAVVLGRRTLREQPVADAQQPSADVRQPGADVRQPGAGPQQQTFIALPPSTDGFEYAVLITSSDLPLAAVAQLYRDRADAENINDELKNHWGWGGFTTDDLARTAIMARFTALFYNWWTMYCRGLMPHRHTEAITARPLLVHGVGIQIRHRGQRLLRLTGVAQAASAIAAHLSRAAQRTATWARTVAQLTPAERWLRYADDVLDRVIAAMGTKGPLTVGGNRGI